MEKMNVTISMISAILLYAPKLDFPAQKECAEQHSHAEPLVPY